MNEPIAAVIVGLLLSLSAGVRVTLPLLAVNLLAFYHEITLPENMAWLGTEPTLIILSAACAAETIVHFIPAAGTWLKAMATPLAFVAGTLLMAVPLGDKNPLYQWTLAAAVGGGAATLTHLGVTGARAMTAPANVASLGIFGIVWNIGEFLLSILLAALSGICVLAGWTVGAGILFGIAALVLIGMVKAMARMGRTEVGRAGTQT
ncbi:MAG TPA: DUF4126 domain-containing protein [Candidatus Methylacidiphilales bacterium]|nr:DUF4126 domain-containing protein [Candidatus Methylacidiphilales bacterium]